MIKTLLKIFLLFTILVTFFSLPAVAGKKEKVPKPVGPVFSSNGGVYPVGKYGVVLKHLSIKKDQLYDGTDEKHFVRPKKKKQKKIYEKSIHKTQVIVRAGVLKNFDARLVIPYFDKNIKIATSKKNISKSNSGIGDIKLIGRYRILSQKDSPISLAVGLGISLPTGNSNDKYRGKTLPGFLQIGSGSFDPIFEIGAHKIMDRHWISSHLMYVMTTKGKLGDRDFERPDVFKYNVAYGFAFSKKFDVGIELNGIIKTRAELDGVIKDNTGGHSVFLTPGIHFKFARGMHFDICTPIAVYHNLNGPQLAEEYQIAAKLAFKF